MDIKVIEHNSEEYGKAVALRDKILRRPLGLSFKAEDLAKEDSNFHIAGFY
jgi:hypothetical protein